MTIPGLNLWMLPKTSNDTGMGFLMSEGDKIVTKREREMEKGIYPEKPDFLQQ